MKVGILGGGQLGKMLCQAGSRWGLDLHVLDLDPAYPAAQVNPKFTTGDFAKEEDVYRFGSDKDIVTIEIEHVNVEALERLASEGVSVYPAPSVLRIIKDKSAQKQFYVDHGIPTAPYTLFGNKQELLDALQKGILKLPFVQKTRTAGYDGRGVAVIRGASDMEKLLEGPCIAEELVDMVKEVSVVVARGLNGEIKTFPSVEMAFNPEANLVELLLCPARLSSDQETEAETLAIQVAEAFDTVGLLAVEMFELPDGRFLVNEVAPRPHNSGHHTIECCFTSQYEQHLRAILGLPLGDTSLQRPGVMINLLGEPGFSGPVHYLGWEECMHIPGAFFHLYGKSETRPFRKMGHVTTTAASLEEAVAKADHIRTTLKVVSQ